MDVAGDEHDGLAVARQRVDLRVREPARIGQLARRLADRVEILHVRLGRDDGHDLVLAQGGLAERLHLHARRARRQRAEVRRDLFVVGEDAVGSNVDAEELRRRLHGGVGGDGEEGQDDQRALHGRGL